jgi:hypothetical protein
VSSMTVTEAHEAKLRAARARWPQYPLADIEAIEGGYVVDRASGSLFQVVASEVLEALYPEAVSNVSGFFVNEADELTFIRRADPGTLAELQQQREREQREQEQAREREAERRAEFIARQPQRPVTLEDLTGEPLPTLREAARLILDLGGEIKARGETLVITAPERLDEVHMIDLERREGLRRACRVLAAAAPLVLAELERAGRKGLDVDRLPDAQVLAAGGVES